MSEDRLVRSELIPGKIDHFRAIMERFVLLHTQKWESSDGKILFFREVRKERDGQDVTLPTRATWRVIFAPIHGPGVAAIEAYELPEGRGTRVDFMDGYAPEFPQIRDPIGPAFEEFVAMVIREAQQLCRGQTSITHNSARPKPSEPEQGASLDQWFDWYYACIEAGFRITLQDIADKAGYSLSHVKNRHALYKASRDG